MFSESFISIAGPTGCGKTAFVLQLAKEMPISVVNIDLGQMYAPYSVGVAQPSAKEKASCPHHLFSFLDQPKDFSVVEYRALAEKICQKIWAEGRIPVFVGGSTLYQQSLFFQLPELPTRCFSSSQHSSLSNQELWNMLYQVDSVRAMQIHFQDRYRLERALTIWFATGNKPSTYSTTFSPLTQKGLVVFLTRPRDVLCNDINRRAKEMLASGWINEVASLSEEWRHFAKKKGLIGYSEIIDWLDLNKTQDLESFPQALVTIISQQTRNYAKRQETFFRRFARMLAVNKLIETVECDLTLSSHDLYIEQIVHFCSQYR